jgi:hypothetical protein
MPLQSDTPKNDRPRPSVSVRKELRCVGRGNGLKGKGHDVVTAKDAAQGLPRHARCRSAEAATHQSEVGLRATGERR